jgi:hypothetical protein
MLTEFLIVLSYGIKLLFILGSTDCSYDMKVSNIHQETFLIIAKVKFLLLGKLLAICYLGDNDN